MGLNIERAQGCIYWKIPPPPPSEVGGKGKKYQSMLFEEIIRGKKKREI
jgi:hypothetical protein